MKQLIIQQNNLYRYNLYGEIQSFDIYAEFIEDTTQFSENDVVMLYINSPGGDVAVGASIINAINSTKAQVHAVVEAPSYSMASLIALSCNNLAMFDNTFLMFHNYSAMSCGKGGELLSYIHHSDKHFNNLIKTFCYPFLTKKELAKIQRDEDIYIYSSDETLEKRKARHFK